MHTYRAVEILVTSVNLFVVIRLLAIHALRLFPVLFGFLVYELLQNALTVLMSATSRAYGEMYTVTEPFVWIFYIFIVREMYRRAFADYPGIASIARWASYLSVGLTALASVIVVVVSPPAHRLSALFSYVAFWERFTCFALAAFIICMIFLLAKYPIKIGWNEAVNIITFTIYFFGNFAALEITDGLIRNYAVLVLTGSCYLVWGLLLTGAAEKPSLRVRINLDAFEEQRLMDQLAALNNMLVK